jgi:hypothetical protein
MQVALERVMTRNVWDPDGVRGLLRGGGKGEEIAAYCSENR